MTMLLLVPTDYHNITRAKRCSPLAKIRQEIQLYEDEVSNTSNLLNDCVFREWVRTSASTNRISLRQRRACAQ